MDKNLLFCSLWLNFKACFFVERLMTNKCFNFISKTSRVAVSFAVLWVQRPLCPVPQKPFAGRKSLSHRKIVL